MINGFIKGQAFKLSAPVIVSDTIKYLEAKFHFQTSDWDGASKWAHFKQGDVVYDVHLDSDDSITKGDSLNLSNGRWEVYLHGTKEDGTRITTESAFIEVKKSGILDGEPFPDAPLTAIEQLDNRVTALEKSGTGGGGGVPSDVELQSNRVTVVDNLSDDKHYPTAKAAFDATERIVATGEDGDTVPKWCKIMRTVNENHNGKTVLLEMAGTPVVGSVSADKAVALSDDLEAGMYDISFGFSDGSALEFGTIEER